MSFFKNLQKVVSSQIFTKSNNYLLTSRFRINYLVVSQQPSIEYAHTAKSFLQTIAYLERNKDHKSLGKHVNRDLSMLQNFEHTYSQSIAQYVYRGGNITAEAIANIYYSAERLKFTSEWLENNISYMTKQNLIDVQAGLQKYHKESPYLSQVKQRLAKWQDDGQVRYVEHQACESNRFLYTQNSSNNVLIQSIRQNLNEYKYLLISNSQKGYALHSDQ